MSQQSSRYLKPSHASGWPSGRSPTTGDHPNRRFWPLVALAAFEFACLVAILLIWLSPYPVTSTYQGLDGEFVVKIRIATTKIPHLILVRLNFPAQGPNSSKSTECFMKQGDHLTLQGDILLFAPSQNNIGLHSGYKFVRLIGCYRDANFQHKLNFNIDEDSFFSLVQGQAWFAWLEKAQAFPSTSISLRGNLPIGQSSETYIVHTSQNKPYIALSH